MKLQRYVCVCVEWQESLQVPTECIALQQDADQKYTSDTESWTDSAIKRRFSVDAWFHVERVGQYEDPNCDCHALIIN